MRSTAVLASLAALLLLACGPSQTPPPAGPPASPTAPPAKAAPPAAPAKDVNVREGDGWKRTGPGQWTYGLDGDRAPDFGLTAYGNGQGVQRIALPAGAKKARVAALRVAYVEPGKATWTLVKDMDGQPAESELAVLQIAIRPADVTAKGKPPIWIDHALVGAPVIVEGAFYALFSSTDQPRPSVAALRNKGEGKGLFYRMSPRSRLAPVAHLAYGRVVLEGVE